MFLTPGGQTRFPKKRWFMFKRSELPALKQLKQTFTVWTEISVFWCLITMKGKVITRLTRRRRLPTTKVFVMIWWGSLKNVPACPDQQSDSSYRHAAELGDGSGWFCLSVQRSTSWIRSSAAVHPPHHRSASTSVCLHDAGSYFWPAVFGFKEQTCIKS